MYAPKLWCNKATRNSLGYFAANPREKNCSLQQIVGTFLYYARAMEFTMLPDLNTIAEQQSNPTKNNEAEITKFLDYAGTNLSAIIQYKSSDMILHTDSDASYLSEPWARSRNGGHYYLRLLPSYPEKDSNLPPPANIPIHIEWIILKHVVEFADK